VKKISDAESPPSDCYQIALQHAILTFAGHYENRDRRIDTDVSVAALVRIQENLAQVPPLEVFAFATDVACLALISSLVRIPSLTSFLLLSSFLPFLSSRLN